MALITNKNFSLDRLTDFNPNPGDIIESCNLFQKYPHTKITEVVGLTFRMCNLVNCDLPADALVEGMKAYHISYCGHLNDGYTCAIDCEHVVSSEQIIVDGVVVDTLYEYADRRVD